MKVIAIGYDRGESIAFHTLVHSIMTRASEPVSFIPIIRSALKQFTRERGNLDSTDFSISRFLVPAICGYHGQAVFMDCDIIVQDDIVKLFDQFDDQFAIQVVKHNYHPRENIKMDDRIQTRYRYKNWSSVMLFNNQACRALTYDYVNTAPGLDLHQFAWLDDHSKIGEITPEWNHLVGFSDNVEPKALHYTTGGPWFDHYRACDNAEEWVKEYLDMIYPFKFWFKP